MENKERDKKTQMETYHSPGGLTFIINGRYLTCRETNTFLLKWVKTSQTEKQINKILKEHNITRKRQKSTE